jgi:hypothetical protein
MAMLNNQMAMAKPISKRYLLQSNMAIENPPFSSMILP